jgi:hypothetical protein
MSDEPAALHWSFWAIGAVALIWHLMGIMNYLMQMNPEAVANYPETHRAIIEGRPAWATSGFALSVFGGAIGGLLLLLKKSIAAYAFMVSLAGTVLTMIHTLRVEADFSLFERILMIVMPLAVAAFLIWYSKQAERKSWIG